MENPMRGLTNTWIASCILVATSIALTQRSEAQTCPVTETDKTAVVETMRTLFAAEAVQDYPKIHSVTAPDFYGFDLGRAYDGIDSLVAPVKAQQDQGDKFVWNVTKPRVTIHCSNAWITYVNDGSFQRPGEEPIGLQWLESAILEKQSGTWRIVFFHSTRVPPPALVK
jgi:hypothetical protein